MTGTADELELAVAAAVKGDRTAASRVLELVQPGVVRYCRSRVGGSERANLSADDVAQEVLIAVLSALPGYRDQGRPFMAFVYGIASHKVADAHRGNARNKSDPVEYLPEVLSDDTGPEDHLLEGEVSDAVRALLQTLPEKQREIVRLRVVVGLSAEETAEIVDSTAGAVRVAQHRAMKQLRATIEKDGEERWR
ncbi:putative RNA polymerase sigma-D factor [Dietzia sp. NCCP-2495]|uniref:sigma-70 family RNA polymerase sigma factor n=1 Tax=Dietzia sp. NCCP-2495 TaxID=2934675 RepID=UPI00223021D6|nr:sigma-70 family RNA polymerase sigma factor [Dietzia sp. NCCP-2495]GLB64998.1 putative RNA polymerase sigma-D factor [Dietzia sp. NCCP-2495]